MHAHTSAMAKRAFAQLCLLCQGQPFLNEADLVTVTHALVIARLDYFNTLFIGSPCKLFGNFYLFRCSSQMMWSCYSPVVLPTVPVIDIIQDASGYLLGPNVTWDLDASRTISSYLKPAHPLRSLGRHSCMCDWSFVTGGSTWSGEVLCRITLQKSLRRTLAWLLLCLYCTSMWKHIC